MISVIIVMALVALMQVSASRSGQASPLTTAVTTIGFAFEEGVSAIAGGLRGGVQTAGSLPKLEKDNAHLQRENAQLREENARLTEALAQSGAQAAIAPSISAYPGAIKARVIGYPPENTVQSVTLDKGTTSGVHVDDGVLAAQGVVGRVVETTPFTSKVALLTDFTSTVPAILARGRYWGVAKGNQTSVRLEYISQDAPLRIGDYVVTGEARSFHSGAIIGRVTTIERSPSALYQSAVVKPAVDFSRLDLVVVIPK